MSAKLTKAQQDALAAINRSAEPHIRFPTGEALRKLGLVVRETNFVVKRDYANKNGVHPQWEGSPRPSHYWYLTPAGRSVLNSEPSR